MRMCDALEDPKYGPEIREGWHAMIDEVSPPGTTDAEKEEAFNIALAQIIKDNRNFTFGSIKEDDEDDEDDDEEFDCIRHSSFADLLIHDLQTGEVTPYTLKLYISLVLTPPEETRGRYEVICKDCYTKWQNMCNACKYVIVDTRTGHIMPLTILYLEIVGDALAKNVYTPYQLMNRNCYNVWKSQFDADNNNKK